MLIKQHKSGQATIVLIVVTMMTVLGVAVASSSQSRINLRDTVYSTQSVQALACAEAGADRALVSAAVQGDQTTFTTTSTFDSTGADYEVEGCDSYNTRVTSYPENIHEDAFIRNVPENSVQEFNSRDFEDSPNVHRINFRSNEEGTNPALAIYRYYSTTNSITNSRVARTMVYCNSNGLGPDPLEADDDFDAATFPAAFQVEHANGTIEQVTDGCSVDIGFPETQQVVLRIRPLYTDVLLEVEDFRQPTGYQIISTGIAGQVQRDINVLRFYSQLSGTFDEAIVAGDEIEN